MPTQTLFINGCQFDVLLCAFNTQTNSGGVKWPSLVEIFAPPVGGQQWGEVANAC